MGIVLSIVGAMQRYMKIYKSWLIRSKIEHFQEDIPLKISCTRQVEESAIEHRRTCSNSTVVNLKGFFGVVVKIFENTYI